MSDTFKRQMVARGVAQVLADMHSNMNAINALSAEGIEPEEIELITFELSKRSISTRDINDAVNDFMSEFVARF